MAQEMRCCRRVGPTPCGGCHRRLLAIGRVMMRRALLLMGFSIALLFPSSASWAEATTPILDSARMTELWEEPSDIRSRDLYYGPGGPRLVPRTDVTYRVVGLDTKGHSCGYDLLDPEGRKWAVKIGDEAQSDLVVSRILWAIGYRQPITYYVPEWRMSGGEPKDKPAPGRFRLGSDHKSVGEWSWNDNPFVGTRPFHGLIVVNLILNNWDLTASNNRTYKMKTGVRPERWYVVQDVGGSLGKTRWPIGTRNDIDDFESEKLIEGVKEGRVNFTYRARS